MILLGKQKTDSEIDEKKYKKTFKIINLYKITKSVSDLDPISLGDNSGRKIIIIILLQSTEREKYYHDHQQYNTI